MPFFALPAFAAGTPENPIEIDISTVNADGDGFTFNAGNGRVTINADGYYKITGEATGRSVRVNAADVTITLNNAKIEAPTGSTAFWAYGGTLTLILVDGTENFITGGGHNPGIRIESNETLIINGNTGKLTVSAGTDTVSIGGAAGIGGTSNTSDAAGTIIINGGIIIAQGGNGVGTNSGGGAGIGGGGTSSGTSGAGGNVIINGGTVTATGGNGAGTGGNGAAIGGGGGVNGAVGAGGTLTQNGGTIGGVAPPTISIGTHPASTSVTEGSITGNLSVSGVTTSDGTLSYQWFFNTTNSNIGGTAIGGATSDTFVIPTGLTAAGSPYYYFVEIRATIAGGGAQADKVTPMRSSVATVTVNDDNGDITTAKGLIEGGTYTVAQATANTEPAVKTWLVAQINALAGMAATGIIVAEGDIAISGFSAATTGVVGNLTGTDGSFSFTVTLNKGGGTQQITDSRNGTITATPYDASGDNAAITTAKGLIEGGTYTVAQSVANTETAVKTWLVSQINALTGMAATGITVAEADITVVSFTAATAGTAASVNGTNGAFSFTVTLNKGGGTQQVTAPMNGTITATPLSDADAVAADKAWLTWDAIRGTNAAQNNVTANLVNPLPLLGSNGSAISWASSDAAVVDAATSAVTRPPFGSGDANVTLTATISKGAASDTVTFNLTVIAALGHHSSTASIPVMGPVGLVLLVLMLAGMVMRQKRRVS